MGEVVNLRMARKRAARERDSDRADANRTAHGVRKDERERARREERRAARLIDGAKRSPDTTSPSDP